jgi:hypothetical protein
MCILSTRGEFDTCLLRFYKESNSCSSEITKWSWESANSLVRKHRNIASDLQRKTKPYFFISKLKQSFIRRKSTILVPSEPSTARDFEMNDQVEESEDPTLVNHAVSIESIYLEHHIVYSTTYQVPVLYFTASYSDSTPLSHEEIYRYIVSQSYQHVVLSQAEHPVLNIPCWYIHPCDTRVLMSTLKFDQTDYIKSWLSVQGPLVKCQISIDMFK